MVASHLPLIHSVDYDGDKYITAIRKGRAHKKSLKTKSPSDDMGLDAALFDDLRMVGQ